MEKYIPYLLKFAFMIFAVFPAIKHEWLAISVGVIALAIPLVCFVWCWISDSVMKAFEHVRKDSIYNVMISFIGFVIYYSVYDYLLIWIIILACYLFDFCHILLISRIKNFPSPAVRFPPIPAYPTAVNNSLNNPSASSVAKQPIT